MLARRNHRKWLPDGALTGSVLEYLLAGALKEWSSAWFPHGVTRSIQSPPSMRLQDGGYWMDTGLGLAIAVPVAAHAQLISHMLDVSLSKEPQTASDRRIIGDLAHACLDDLGQRLATAFKLSANPTWNRLNDGNGPAIKEPRELGLGIGAKPALVKIVVDTDLVIDLVKAALPANVNSDPVQPIATGLASQTVAVTATLGRCSVTVADMAGLSIGDVLIFDRGIDEALGLTIDGRAIFPDACTIGQVDDRLQLKLLEPLDR